MKKLLIVTAFLLVFGYSASAQCVERPADPCISINQSLIDRAGKAADELLAARDALVKFSSERIVTDAERKAAAVLIDGLNGLVATNLRIQDAQNKVIELYKQVIEMQQGIIEKLEKMLNKPKSAWQKFVAILEKVTLVLAGVAIASL